MRGIAGVLIMLALGSGCAHAPAEREPVTGAPGASGEKIAQGAPKSPSSEELEERCGGGVESACHELFLGKEDAGRRHSLLRRFDNRLAHACEKGSVGACAHRPWLWAQWGFETPGIWARIAEWYERACDLEVTTACFRLAEVLEAGFGTSRGGATPLSLYSRVCSDGNERACARAASLPQPRADPAPIAKPEGSAALPKPEKAPSATEPVRIGGQDKDQLLVVIQAAQGRVKQCYEAELQARPYLGGNIDVTYLVGPDGRVENALVTRATLPSPPVVACVLEITRGYRFPEDPSGARTQVNFPWTFATPD
jgi:hypothetical protein